MELIINCNYYKLLEDSDWIFKMFMNVVTLSDSFF